MNLPKKLAFIGPLCQSQPQISSPEVYFIDGGGKWRTNSDQLLIGDNDSLKTNANQFTHLLPKNKDQSDFCHALSLLEEQDYALEIHGMYGGDMAHQLAIFGEAHRFLKNRNASQLQFYSDQSLKATQVGRGQWQFDHQGRFSLFTLEPQEISIRGNVLYPLESMSIQILSSHGLSNEAKGSFQVNAELPLILLWD